MPWPFFRRRVQLSDVPPVLRLLEECSWTSKVNYLYRAAAFHVADVCRCTPSHSWPETSSFWTFWWDSHMTPYLLVAVREQLDNLVRLTKSYPRQHPPYLVASLHHTKLSCDWVVIPEIPLYFKDTHADHECSQGVVR